MIDTTYVTFDDDKILGIDGEEKETLFENHCELEDFKEEEDCEDNVQHKIMFQMKMLRTINL